MMAIARIERVVAVLGVTITLLSWISLSFCHAFVVPPLQHQRYHCHYPALSSSSSSLSRRVSMLLQMASSEENLFSKYCDSDGFMTRQTLAKVPEIAQLLSEGDLSESELDAFWNGAPKFPSASTSDETGSKIDVDSFVQIYRDIDELFEEDDDTGEASGSTDAPPGASIQDGEDDDDEDEDEQALEQIFETLCDREDAAKLLSKEDVKQWDEVDRLLKDGLLGEDEFESLWRKTPKSPGTNDLLLDVDGFLSFNAFLDDLFVIEDDEMMETDDDDDDDPMVQGETDDAAASQPRPMVSSDDGDMPPGVLFAALANSDYLVGSNELQLWEELQDMLKQGDLLAQELQDFYTKYAVAKKDKKRYLTEESFIGFYESIYNLFDDDDDDEAETTTKMTSNSNDKNSDAKEVLMELIQDMQQKDDNERLPCGLEATEEEEKLIQKVVTALEKSPNLILETNGSIKPDNLVGEWKLLYCSSASVKFNKGLSGLGGSFPNGKFGGLIQRLESARFKQDVEYVEQINVKPDTASFQVNVNGAWELRKSISLFTNQPCTMLYVEPNRVKYGPTSTRADHWKSLGPMNMLDVTYLDDDLRIMRGNTATDSIFVFERIQQE